MVLSNYQRRAFAQNSDCYIPGYTGHIPSLKFLYGRSFGFRTREIIKEMHDNPLFFDLTPGYGEYGYNPPIIQPVDRDFQEMNHLSTIFEDTAPPYVAGYTGFVPTLEFHHGKSYGRAVDDSFKDMAEIQRKMDMADSGSGIMLKANSTPGHPLNPKRSYDYFFRVMNKHTEPNEFE